DFEQKKNTLTTAVLIEEGWVSNPPGAFPGGLKPTIVATGGRNARVRSSFNPPGKTPGGFETHPTDYGHYRFRLF
ncbi:MAG TPA: hypothetical protein PLP42_16250, partial [Acidobacteriota bacterium]|nr:hypothetical protein [Acidobacteriota bacterium]